jgi:hypothetical protein
MILYYIMVKKFHIRVYIIYYNDKKTFIYNKFRLAIAKEKL